MYISYTYDGVDVRSAQHLSTDAVALAVAIWRRASPGSREVPLFLADMVSDGDMGLGGYWPAGMARATRQKRIERLLECGPVQVSTCIVRMGERHEIAKPTKMYQKTRKLFCGPGSIETARTPPDPRLPQQVAAMHSLASVAAGGPLPHERATSTYDSVSDIVKFVSLREFTSLQNRVAALESLLLTNGLPAEAKPAPEIDPFTGQPVPAWCLYNRGKLPKRPEGWRPRELAEDEPPRPSSYPVPDDENDPRFDYATLQTPLGTFVRMRQLKLEYWRPRTPEEERLDREDRGDETYG